MVEAWYANCLQSDAETIVYYYGAPGFSYYLCHDDRYSYQIEEKIIYWPQLHQNYYEMYTKEQCQTMLREKYDGEWPQKIYLAGSHYNLDFYYMVELLNEKGYAEEMLFDGRLADIYMFTKE